MPFSLRYSRQISLPQIGEEGQKSLSMARIMIVGCGALGSMIAMQLAGAGIGTIGIADFDTVDISNLQRQFFFKTGEAGELKANVLKDRIRELNPEVEVKTYNEIVTSTKAPEIYQNYDFIIDATDTPESKRMTGEICGLNGLPCCIGGVQGFIGQVITLLKDDSRFEEYFGTAESGGFLPCSLGGVLGPAAALTASIMATEAIKFVIQQGTLLSGQILYFNLLEDTFLKFSL